MAQSVEQMIRAAAARYNIDPVAALAVAAGEGGIRLGAVGDQGTSHGPFQLRASGAPGGGASPFAGVEETRRFANSAQGIDYAIRKMAEAGAAGLRGQAAVNTIIRKFERPADPDTSVARALGRYKSGQFGRGDSPVASQQGPGGSVMVFDAVGFRRAIAAGMLGNASARLKGGKPGKNVLSVIKERSGFMKPMELPGGLSTQQYGSGDQVSFQGGGDWGGSKQIAEQFRDMAVASGLTVTSEKRDRQHTKSGGTSDHWSGSKSSYAFDLSNGSRPTKEMDAAAMRIARSLGHDWDGKSELVLNKTVNGYRVQVIYRSNVGGNHFDHIHVGVRRAGAPQGRDPHAGHNHP